jgi:hypothetical protein
MNTDEPYVAVRASDGAGTVLATSKAVKPVNQASSAATNQANS